jgi:CelD/BcsL family acetyltransferase involved in cellulose biosynthesis
LFLHGSHAAPALTITTASDEIAFDALRDEWDELLCDSAQHGYFLRYTWNRQWWAHLAPPRARLHIIVCRDEDGRLVGLAPLYLRRFSYFGVGLRELCFLGTGIGLRTSEHLDLIVRRGWEGAVAKAITDHLTRQTVWDRMSLVHIPARSTMLPRVSALLGKKVTTAVVDRAPFIDTSGSWEAYRKGFGRSMRRNLEYHTRRLFARHQCQFQLVKSPAQLASAIEALIRLHQARWRAKGEPGSFAQPGFDDFLRSVTDDDLANGRLRLWHLRVDGVIEAALVGFLDNGVLHYFQSGFNPSFARENLGTVMLTLSLRSCFEDPDIKVFDFMGGAVQYKDLWARSSELALRCEVNATAGARMQAAARRVAGYGMAVLRAVTPASVREARRERRRADRLRKLTPVTSGPELDPSVVSDASGRHRALIFWLFMNFGAAV